MESFGGARKRGRPDGATGNGGLAGSKRSREMDSSQLGSKSKPCTKFFRFLCFNQDNKLVKEFKLVIYKNTPRHIVYSLSETRKHPIWARKHTTGCPFGEGCHFQHFVPGGYNAVAQMTNMGNLAAPPPARGPVGLPPMSDPRGHGPPPSVVKTKMCNRFKSAEGCKFGDKCHFAHGERELGKPILPSHESPMAPPPAMGGGGGRMGGGRGHGQFDPPPQPAPASFGASATAKISVDASLAGGIIGKGGANTKHICRVTGARLSIRENESDANLKNIELEGTLDQIHKASAMVQELIMNIGASNPPPPAKLAAPVAAAATYGPASSNYKTKPCEKFAKGSCTFGDRCHFAHGAAELRKTSV